MLETVVEETIGLGERDYNVEMMLSMCNEWRDALDQAAEEYAATIASTYQIPQQAFLEALRQSKQYPQVDEPRVVDLSALAVPSTDVRRRALEQVKVYEFMDPSSDSAQSLLEFLHTIPSEGSVFKTVTGLRNIEQFMYQQSGRLYRVTMEAARANIASQIALKWNAIEGRKLQARQLEAQIEDSLAEVRKYERLLDDEVTRLRSEYSGRRYRRKPSSPQTRSYEGSIRAWNDDVESKRNELIRVENMPEYVISPLPVSDADALELLFFLNMPNDLGLLAHLSCTAQLAMGKGESIHVQLSCSTSWMSHFNQHARLVSSAVPQYVTAFPKRLDVPSSYGPKNINDVWSLGDFRSRCLWFPDASIELAWFGPLRIYVNPFLITHEDSICWLTAQATDWDWANAYPGGNTRGNTVYAKADEISLGSEDFAEYVGVTSLRAYPVLQLRKLFTAMESDTIQWQRDVMGILSRQAVYQVGVLTDEAVPRFQWHFDLLSSITCAEFCAALAKQVARVEASPPQRWENIPILGELAGFLSQYHDGAASLQNRLSKTARKFASEIRCQWQEGVSQEQRAELRSRECLLYGYGLICRGFGACTSDTELQDVCDLLVLFYNSLLFATDAKVHNMVKKIEYYVSEIMARRIHSVLGYISCGDTSAKLSALCRLVNTQFPSALTWYRVNERSAGRVPSSFEAMNEGQHYLINLATGMVLMDGNLPGSLPLAIRGSPKFVDLFGEQDFEVTYSKGVFSTTYASKGYYYKFAVVNEDLVVEESCKKGSKTIQLCSPEWIEAFKNAFPPRLTEMHSHWYWPRQHCVLLRSRQIDDKSVSFVVKFRGASAICYQVPTVDHAQLDASGIVTKTHTYNSLVVANPELLSVFEKFEDRRYIHFLSSPTSDLEIDFPRARIGFFCGEDNIFTSKDFSGYVLAPSQQLNDSFSRFCQHLVLQDATNDSTRAHYRVLVPFGQILLGDDGNATVKLPNSCSGQFRVSVFDMHPRLNVLETESIESRLQLANIYAASGNFLPSKSLSMTGGEAALVVLRGCVPPRPFSVDAAKQLTNLTSWSWRTPSLKLLAALLAKKSRRLAFLYGEAAALDSIEYTCELEEYAAMCSMKQAQAKSSLRQLLTRSEENELMGNASVYRESRFTRDEARLEPVDLPRIPVNRDVVSKMEGLLLELVSPGKLQVPPPVFPLDHRHSNTMSAHMMEELRDSWDTHHRHPVDRLDISLDGLAKYLVDILARVKEKRDCIHKYLIGSVETAHADWRDQLLKTVNRVPTLTMVDLLRSAIDEDTLLQLAPRLSLAGRKRFRLSVVRLMELCVLEDKLERVIGRARSNILPSLAYFVEELRCRREWSGTEHPYWLVFEVEGRLQIRHEQYVIAKHLLDQPGSVSQLNMGRGKTRVILPMLFLYWSYHSHGQVVRAHFLSPLLSETRQFMHRVLSSGILRLSLMEQPFERQKELTGWDVLRLQEAAREVKLCGGVQMVAPEHRLSLELKRLELEALDEKDTWLVKSLDTLLNNDAYVDIFDESDALLHHKYHLVYAVGTPCPLENASDRWSTAEALLSSLMNPESRKVQALLRELPDQWCHQPEYSDRRGAFNGFRLKASADDLEEYRAKFRRVLVDDLLTNAPFELAWLEVFSSRSKRLRRHLLRFVCDVEADPEELLSKMRGVSSFKHQLLALRGLISFGVLEHCLEKRNRVSFGLPVPGSRPKLLAIPFQAADLPSERAEFCHPDVSIVLTLLAYYHAGLRDEEVFKAFQTLLLLDESERARYYDAWFDSVKSLLSEEDRTLLRSMQNIVLDNAVVVNRLHEVYRYCMGTINFYLNRIVFPRDTRQYPQRLARSAWDLVRGPRNVGFSGTNDNHRLLPLAVTQREPDEPSLRGTNGKMLDLLLQYSIGYEVLHVDEACLLPVWKTLLLMAVKKKCRALIDTGALLAGVPTHDAASFLAERCSSFLGITYYDTRKNYDCWVVLDGARQAVAPLKGSAIHERDTFVLFDEARSRGSDMKLLPDACALLTLGPKMTKDKLMQGAGRMRQLGCDQTLWLTSTDEVQKSVQRSTGADLANLDVRAVLQWVGVSTQEQCTLGVLEWASSGVEFCAKETESKLELKDDDWSLEGQYGSAQTSSFIEAIVHTRVEQFTNGKHGDQTVESIKEMLGGVKARATLYGLDDEVHVSAYGEECERELQVEKEQEIEKIVELSKQKPLSEKDWDYKVLLKARSVQEVCGAVQIFDMKALTKSYLSPAGIATMDWGMTKLYATKNFWPSIVSRSLRTVWTGYLRLIDVMVVFEDGTILLLSEQEADEIIKMLLTDSRHSGGFKVVHLEFVRSAVEACGRDVKYSDVALSLGVSSNGVERMEIRLVDFLACCLLNGDTNLVAKALPGITEEWLRVLLAPMKQREDVLCNFIAARRFAQRWPRSTLHALAMKMDLEDCAIAE
ncbi:hypothetical protein Poli38472_013224 [Pythium oligandrum]|uniref:ubiquitinyl hydrolase 1 n=1 Tax=Pythium oligandrum TaxID=41045 RepID=A0A8K1FDY2_PYTOL|nr:hypothetical protein Poli38472_013224 [Pythium oligandrum]|eukprot:TMW55333.1 hypothetical protein Poli38472_013224 [Pythium oligandrum]